MSLIGARTATLALAGLLGLALAPAAAQAATAYTPMTVTHAAEPVPCGHHVYDWTDSTGSAVYDGTIYDQDGDQHSATVNLSKTNQVILVIDGDHEVGQYLFNPEAPSLEWEIDGAHNALGEPRCEGRPGGVDGARLSVDRGEGGFLSGNLDRVR